MSFRKLDFQKIDTSGKFALNEEYLFSYSYSDGWTRRLLRFCIFIDIYYDCRGQISFYNTKPLCTESAEVCLTRD